MNFLAFWMIAMFIIGLSVAVEEEIPSSNLVFSTDEVEGRNSHECNGCGSGSGTTHAATQLTFGAYDHNWLNGFRGLAFTALPLLAVNIVGVVLLAILLKTILEPEPQHYYQPAYVPQTTYQSYDGGASSYAKSGVAANAFKKRSVEESQYFPSHSTLQFLTKIIGDAIDKYNNINDEE